MSKQKGDQIMKL